MQTFIDFLVNNYSWFLIISLVLIFALIGYLVDTNERKGSKNEAVRLDTTDANDTNGNQNVVQNSGPVLESITENEQK